MTIVKNEAMENDAVRTGAAMMALAMRTAPKTRGTDSLKTAVVSGDDLEALAAMMEKKGGEKSTELPIFKRDAGSVRKAAAVLLVGVNRDPKKIDMPFNCGACGYGTCRGLEAAGPRQGEDFAGPTCVFQAIDIGVALGSAVKLAAEMGIDNRIMYTAGAAAKALGLLDSDVIMAIPLSATGKNPFFDRGWKRCGFLR